MWYVRPCRASSLADGILKPVGSKENTLTADYLQSFLYSITSYQSKKGAPHISIYHCSIKIISRGKGKSAVAAAAYRAGTAITNEYDGIHHDYTHKKGIAYTEILLPENAPTIYENRTVLWNAVEKVEKSKNAQLAREIEIALPAKLDKAQNISLVRDYVQRHFVNAGMCADICIHDKKDGNPHAHILLTMRPFNQDGTWGDKQRKEYAFDENGNKIYDAKKRQYKCKSVFTTDWNEQTKAEDWRKAWADSVNAALEKNNQPDRIDHRSYKRQGIEQIPSIHLGATAAALERKGIRTERGDKNRKIVSLNQEIRQLRARINKLQKWVDGHMENEKHIHPNAPNFSPDNLISLLSHILETGEGKSQKQKVIDLKTASSTLLFLQANNISTLPELKEKVIATHDKLYDIREKMKPIERRLAALNQHLLQADNYKENKAIYKHYHALPPKKQPSFYTAHTPEIILFESAQRYLKSHLNGHNKIPVAQWKAEHKNLTVEKEILYREFKQQKEEVRQVEIIQKYATQLVRENAKEVLRVALTKEKETAR
jgi:MobA/MobL family.